MKVIIEKDFKNERNRVIAEYDNKKWIIDKDGSLLLSQNNGRSWYGVLYDEDWNALMTVVQKIKKENSLDWFNPFINPNLKRLKKVLSDAHILRVWLATYDVILWYNNQEKS